HTECLLEHLSHPGKHIKLVRVEEEKRVLPIHETAEVLDAFIPSVLIICVPEFSAREMGLAEQFERCHEAPIHINYEVRFPVVQVLRHFIDCIGPELETIEPVK